MAHYNCLRYADGYVRVHLKCEGVLLNYALFLKYYDIVTYYVAYRQKNVLTINAIVATPNVYKSMDIKLKILVIRTYFSLPLHGNITIFNTSFRLNLGNLSPN